MMEPINKLTEDLNALLLSQISSFFDICIEIAVVAIFKHKIIIVGSFLHVVQLDYVVTLAAFQHLNLALKQLFELSLV